jgi:hypothetical protein
VIRATINGDGAWRLVGTEAEIRQFSTGATRDTDQGKLDYEGFLSPYALKAFGEYMHRHRLQADGQMRDSDNWQRGIPLDAYMKSMWRHFFDVWSEHRGVSTPAGLKENLCALKFNVDGMLHELVKAEADHTPGAGYAMPLADRED